MSSKLFNTTFQVSTEKVELRVIDADDLQAFREIIFEKETWEFYANKYVNEGDLEEFVEQSIVDFGNQVRVPLAIIDRTKNKIVGSTSFGNISERDKRLEIGWTWLCQSSRGSGVNRHAKYLMLDYAFESLGYYRVEFKTDVLNHAARKALGRIGAIEEGVLRSHTQMHSNRRRDTIYYSILQPEWPNVRETVFSDLRRC